MPGTPPAIATGDPGKGLAGRPTGHGDELRAPCSDLIGTTCGGDSCRGQYHSSVGDRLLRAGSGSMHGCRTAANVGRCRSTEAGLRRGSAALSPELGGKVNANGLEGTGVGGHPDGNRIVADDPTCRLRCSGEAGKLDSKRTERDTMPGEEFRLCAAVVRLPTFCGVVGP
mmetsp:Transcript_87675/g.246300  ORF Transcript_87675/g.246300 Transcript_87675/m.246300 type:complete len:170 (-) Transcript_87675:1237-1746(-)